MKYLVWLVLLCAPLYTFAEAIQTFESTVSIQPDGSFLVSERILYDFEQEPRRGIYRVIPLGFDESVPEQKLFQTRYITIDFLPEVYRDGVAEPYAIESTPAEAVMRIGDPDITYTGVHEYTYQYKVNGALSYLAPGQTELYWNATGNGWEVPINQVVVTVQGPENFSQEQATCYAGPVGSTTTCDVQTDVNNKIFIANNLAAHEGVTVALALNPEVIARQVLLKYDFSVIWIGVITLTCLYFVYALIKIRFEHFRERPTIPMYDAPKNFSALFSGVVIDDVLNPQDISAGIIELAQLGYINIERKEEPGFLGLTQEVFILTLLDKDQKPLSHLQKQVITMLFKGEKTFNTKTSKISETEHSTVRVLAEEQLKNDKVIQKAPYPIALTAGVIAIILTSLFFVVTLDQPTIEALANITIILAVLPLMAIRRKTSFGYEVKKHLDGLKMYIKVAEKDRIAFHDAPAKNPETFTKFLPFAIAFGLEKEWTKAFEDLQIETSWFSDNGNRTFNAVVLSDALHDMTSSVQSTMPASSASGGGGSSGGGSGGGGGGSW